MDSRLRGNDEGRKFREQQSTSSSLTRGAWIAALLLAVLAWNAHAETVIKFATLAPEGSTWMKVMSQYDKELQAKTGGQVRFRFYPGGVAGDEKDVVRKIRFGQLQAAGLTGVGLGEIAPTLRILDAPFLFHNQDDVDHVVGKINADLVHALQAQGFDLLGWTEVGFVYLFTATPVHAPADLKAVKMWVWEGDPIAETAFKEIGVHPISLSITDVMTSMETGLINGVYSSPMAALALQWYTKTKYISATPIAYAAGAVIISRKALDKLSADQRKTLLTLGAKYMRDLTRLSREENRQALSTLKKEGLTIAEPSSPQVLEDYEEIGRRARKDLAGRLYSAELLARVEKALADFRAKHAQKH